MNGKIWVGSYTRRDGRVVKGYFRLRPQFGLRLPKTAGTGAGTR